MAAQPNDYTNLAELTVRVATNWRNKFPNYKVNFIEQSTLEADAIALKTKALANSTQTSTKKSNTEELRKVNAEVKEATMILKKYIAAENPKEKNLGTIFSAYGLEKIGITFYGISVDNDKRAQRISILIAKMEESNDPYANKEFGLAYWQNLQARHIAAWENSKNIKSDKSTLVRETKELFAKCKKNLNFLYKQVAIDFDGQNIASIRREFGFLNEVYK